MSDHRLKTRAWKAILSVLAMLFAQTATTRQYWIAAEDVLWDYAPSDQNLVHCAKADGGCPVPSPWTSSHKYRKVRYIEYTDASFSAPRRQPPWLGVLGPIIRAEVGDTVVVNFCNRATDGSHGIHPHGLRYNKNHEGAHYVGVQYGTPPGAGAGIPPGACFKYIWLADDESGPGPGDASSKVWWYHSHVDEPAETNLGLLGPIIVTRSGWARPNGSPKDVDREFVTAYFVFDEKSGEEAGLMHAINGYIFGNLRGLRARQGETVRWHVLGMGNEVDLHSAHWHGKTLTIGSAAIARRTDTVELLPGSMITADMQADNVGEWMLHCHVADHIHAGMLTTYSIEK